MNASELTMTISFDAEDKAMLDKLCRLLEQVYQQLHEEQSRRQLELGRMPQ